MEQTKLQRLGSVEPNYASETSPLRTKLGGFFIQILTFSEQMYCSKIRNQ